MPEWDEAAVAAAARRVRLSVDPRRRRHGQGVRLGAGPGASLEFHDHRPYVPGDDPRHLDWGVYARSEQLVLRRHRQEVSPRVEVILDGSASMAIVPAKAALACAVAALVMTLAESDGARPTLWWCGQGASRLGRPGEWRAALRRVAAGGAAGLEARPTPALSPGAERLIVSDGLCPGGGAAAVRALGAGAGRIALLQVLTREELAPRELGAVRLEDVEGGDADVVLDADTISAYRQRLSRHQAQWHAALAGRGSGCVTVCADDGFDAALRALVSAGVLATAGARGARA
jgi:uncharacterized protein (DUF58 family)